jgi:hypothetical protein
MDSLSCRFRTRREYRGKLKSELRSELKSELKTWDHLLKLRLKLGSGFCTPGDFS